MNIFAQILGLIALILISYSYQQKDKKKFLFIQIFANIFYAAEYTFLYAYLAVALSALGIIRSICFYEMQKKKENISIFMLFLFEAIVIILGIIMYENIYSIIVIALAMIYTYATWYKDLKRTYSICAISTAFWMVYNFKVGAYIGIISNVIEAFASANGFKKVSDKAEK